MTTQLARMQEMRNSRAGKLFLTDDGGRFLEGYSQPEAERIGLLVAFHADAFRWPEARALIDLAQRQFESLDALSIAEQIAITAQPTETRLTESAEQCGRTVAIHLEWRRWTWAVAVIDYHERQRLRERAPGPALARPLADIGISVRVVNYLEEAGCLTVRDVLERTAAELLAIPNFGRGYLAEVYAAVARLGYVKKKAS